MLKPIPPKTGNMFFQMAISYFLGALGYYGPLNSIIKLSPINNFFDIITFEFLVLANAVNLITGLSGKHEYRIK